MSPDHGNAPVSGRLTGKVAIVCGAGQTPGSTIGNGKAIALLFAQAGASVLCVDRDADRAAETAVDILEADGEARNVTADITNSDHAERIAQAALTEWGRIDILVNNVGTGGGGDGPPHELTEDAFDRILRINLKGAWLVSKAVYPHMEAQNSGSIINISSLASLAGGFQMAYEVSKAGMNRMTKSLAMAGARKGVRCNAILPGLMDTPMAIGGISKARGIPEDELRAERAARVPMGFMGNGWDTAYAALFLASDESRFISGINLPVDGAAHARIG